MIVSFETIVHLSGIPQYLREVRRLLSPLGTYIVSTPKVGRTNRRPSNPHHTVEFSVSDFRELLEKHFTSVELYGQVRMQSFVHRWVQNLDLFSLRRFLPSAARRDLSRAVGTTSFENMTLSDQRIVKGQLRHAHYIVAVCR